VCAIGGRGRGAAITLVAVAYVSRQAAII